jgi:hypothetical protein
MKDNYFVLEVPQGKARRLTIGWLGLALAALVIGGLFTILIVLSRTPFFQGIIPWTDFFHTALVVHVDLTVLVWFLAFAGVLWSLNSTTSGLVYGWLALFLSILGTFIISVAPFLGASQPLMNNYVPVLQVPIFISGLGIFGLGFTILVLRSLLVCQFRAREGGTVALRVGLFTALITALLAIFAQMGSYLGIPASINGQFYYELLFWGSGHVLQFTHTQLMLVAWLWLATVSRAVLPLTARVAMVLFVLGILPTLVTPVIYLTTAVDSVNHKLAWTWLMQYGGGVVALPIGLMVIVGMVKGREVPPEFRAERAALLYSVLLFGVGGLIGFLINGSNVTVPAHYHGSIVGVTLAFMGITYHLMPRLGFRDLTGPWVEWQPAIYGIGQLLHIIGLAWSGGYGVPRKTPGSVEGFQQIAGMGLMGLGGMIAIIGGVLFLVRVFLAMRPVRNS